MNRNLTILILVFCVLSWGSSYVAIKIGLSGFTPTQLASYRFMVAGMISLILLIFQKPTLPTLRQCFQIIGISFWGIFIYHISITYFTLYFEPNVVSFVSNTAPIFMIILSGILLQEKLKQIRWFFFVFALIGIAIMNYQKGQQFEWKHFGLLTIPISGALFFVLQKRLLKEMRSSTMMHYCIISGAIMLLLWDHTVIYEFHRASFESHFSSIYLGVVPTIIAFLLWSYLLSNTDLSNISSYIYLVPVSTLLFSYLLLDQLPQFQTLIGGSLTIISVAFIRK